MPIFELVQEMMFVNTCVKFRDNRLKNEVCTAVTPFQGGRSPLLGGLHVTCDAHVRIRTRDDVCELVCEVSSQLVKKWTLYSDDAISVRTNVHTGRSLMRGYKTSRLLFKEWSCLSSNHCEPIKIGQRHWPSEQLICILWMHGENWLRICRIWQLADKAYRSWHPQDDRP